MKKHTKYVLERAAWATGIPTAIIGSLFATVRIKAAQWTKQAVNAHATSDPEDAQAYGQKAVEAHTPHFHAIAIDKKWIILGLAVLALVLVLLAIKHLKRAKKIRNPGDGVRDPRRRFSAQDRRWAMHCAGSRCEGTIMGMRCPFTNDLRPVHWYPWSKGGPTERTNLVLLCPLHARRKGSRVPTQGATEKLVKRRRKYWPKSQYGYIWAGAEQVTDVLPEDEKAPEPEPKERPARRPRNYQPKPAPDGTIHHSYSNGPF